MRGIPLLLTLVLLSPALTPEATAQRSENWLRIDRPNQEVQFPLHARSVSATYVITNQHNRPVQLLHMRNESPQVSHQISRLLLPPRSSTPLVLTYSPGDYVGATLQSMALHWEQEGNTRGLSLILRTEVPRGVDVQSWIYKWKVGEAPMPKRSYIKPHPQSQLIPVAASCEGAAFQVVLHPPQGGLSHALEITPRNTSQPVSSRVTVRFAGAGKREQVEFFAVVEQTSAGTPKRY